MELPHVETDLILWLNLAATFVFGLSRGLAAVRARLDLFGVVVLAAVVGLAEGIARDVLIGVPPETFRDGRYLVAVAAAAIACFFIRAVLERASMAPSWSSTPSASRSSASPAPQGPGVRTGSGPGRHPRRNHRHRGRHVAGRAAPRRPDGPAHRAVRHPRDRGAAVAVLAHEAGSGSGVYALVGAALCLVVRLVGVRFGINIPVAGREGRPDDRDG